MKIPLNYQHSDYDCVPVTFLNAFSYLCDREEIDSLLIKAIYQQSLDSYDAKGNLGKRGTSEQAVKALSNWINTYSKQVGLGVYCEFLSTNEITVENQAILNTVNTGGVLLACVHFAGSYHYVLVTQIDESFIYIFDPYYLKIDSLEDEFTFIINQPFKTNRRVPKESFFGVESRPFALGEISKREGVLIYRQ